MNRETFTKLMNSLPEAGSMQAMITVTLPYPDASVRPNLIMSVEDNKWLIGVDVFIARVRQSILQRRLPSMRIGEEESLQVGRHEGRLFSCVWNVEDFGQLLPADSEGIRKPQTGTVRQYMVCVATPDSLLSITASFPDADHADFREQLLDFLWSMELE